jgi:hypothetical protein
MLSGDLGLSQRYLIQWEGVSTAVGEDKRPHDWSVMFSALACLFLGGGLFLFIRNNELFAHGGRNLWHLETLVMLGVLGIPFVLGVLHFMRNLRRHREMPS